MYFDGNPTGWDGTGINCYGMGWDRKICPMDKSGCYSGKRLGLKALETNERASFFRSSKIIL